MSRLRASSWVYSLFLGASLLTTWQIAHVTLGDRALDSPLGTALNLVGLLGDGDFWPHLLETGTAFATAFAVAALIGLTIGFTLGSHRFSSEVAGPVLVSLYSVPKVVLYPFILLAFGIGMTAKVTYGAMHGIIPIMIFTMNAVRQVNPVLIDTAKVLQLDRRSTIRNVILPATTPEMFTGLRIGFSLTLLGTLIAEMFGSKRGLGYLLMNAVGLYDIHRIMAITLLLVLFAIGANSIMLAIEHRLYRR